MAREINRLSPRRVATVSESGRYADGGGLWLQVSKSQTGDGSITKSWLYRFMLNGKARQMGLGSLNTVSLAEARAAALECRKLLSQGVDPIEQRRQEKQAQLAANEGTKTFKWCALEYLKGHNTSWRSAKHRQQWENTLRTYAFPVLGDRAVGQIETGAILGVLEPIWTAKTETATRVRQRIEVVLDWATVRGYREGDNPARWAGHLKHTLPSPTKIKKRKHHAALPYAKIGDFFLSLKKIDAVSARALEFLILTAARTGEVIGATWDEVDYANSTWTVPADRMKVGKEHRVPLAPEAIALLKSMPIIDGSPYVFPGTDAKRPMSNMAMLQLLKRMDRAEITAHGFRSTFRDWCAEQTAFPREVAERALAHTVGDATEAAYQRGDLFTKRRKLMEAWAKYCKAPSQKPASVTPIRKEIT